MVGQKIVDVTSLFIRPLTRCCIQSRSFKQNHIMTQFQPFPITAQSARDYRTYLKVPILSISQIQELLFVQSHQHAVYVFRWGRIPTFETLTSTRFPTSLILATYTSSHESSGGSASRSLFSRASHNRMENNKTIHNRKHMPMIIQGTWLLDTTGISVVMGCRGLQRAAKTGLRGWDIKREEIRGEELADGCEQWDASVDSGPRRSKTRVPRSERVKTQEDERESRREKKNIQYL